jgi:hypothetical protein
LITQSFLLNILSVLKLSMKSLPVDDLFSYYYFLMLASISTKVLSIYLCWIYNWKIYFIFYWKLSSRLESLIRLSSWRYFLNKSGLFLMKLTWFSRVWGSSRVLLDYSIYYWSFLI